jgi:hypothetical protein
MPRWLMCLPWFWSPTATLLSSPMVRVVDARRGTATVVRTSCSCFQLPSCIQGRALRWTIHGLLDHQLLPAQLTVVTQCSQCSARTASCSRLASKLSQLCRSLVGRSSSLVALPPQNASKTTGTTTHHLTTQVMSVSPAAHNAETAAAAVQHGMLKISSHCCCLSCSCCIQVRPGPAS